MHKLFLTGENRFHSLYIENIQKTRLETLDSQVVIIKVYTLQFV